MKQLVKPVLLMLLVLGIGYIGFQSGVDNTNYKWRLQKFKEACTEKHWEPKWRRFTGWYCAAENSVDFFE